MAQTGRENSGKKGFITSLFPRPTCWQTAIYLFFIKAFCAVIRICKNERMKCENLIATLVPLIFFRVFTSQNQKPSKFLFNQPKSRATRQSMAILGQSNACRWIIYRINAHISAPK
jgi:hypothetical protein